MRCAKSCSSRAARAALIWATVGFVAFQVTVVVAGDCFAPELYDPEYSARLTRLQAQRAEHPDERLFVMLGSSRTTQLFRPERLPALTAADGRKVLPFNFS